MFIAVTMSNKLFSDDNNHDHDNTDFKLKKIPTEVIFRELYMDKVSSNEEIDDMATDAEDRGLVNYADDIHIELFKFVNKKNI